MEMPETKLKSESTQILSKILFKTFEVPEDTPFDDLIKSCNNIPYNNRDLNLACANERICRILSHHE